MPISMVPMEHLTLFAFDSGKELPMDMEFPHETKVNLQVGRAPIQSKEVPRSTDDHTHVPVTSKTVEVSQPMGSSGT
jgi:hypothetical protein